MKTCMTIFKVLPNCLTAGIRYCQELYLFGTANYEKVYQATKRFVADGTWPLWTVSKEEMQSALADLWQGRRDARRGLR